MRLLCMNTSPLKLTNFLLPYEQEVVNSFLIVIIQENVECS